MPTDYIESHRRYWKTDKYKAAQKRYRASPKGIAMSRRRNKKRREKEWSAATRPPPDLCEVCKEAERRQDRQHLVFDHDHKTGKFRGWLCCRCNRALGFCDDSPRLLRQLADYLDACNGVDCL